MNTMILVTNEEGRKILVNLNFVKFIKEIDKNELVGSGARGIKAIIKQEGPRDIFYVKESVLEIHESISIEKDKPTAVAPDLLEALQQAQTIVKYQNDEYGSYYEELEEINRAINKAIEQ